MNEDNLSPVEVFAGTEIEAVIVKNLLENGNIDAYLWNELHGIGLVFGITEGVKVVVTHQNYLRTKEIVDDYFRNIG